MLCFLAPASPHCPTARVPPTDKPPHLVVRHARRRRHRVTAAPGGGARRSTGGEGGERIQWGMRMEDVQGVGGVKQRAGAGGCGPRVGLSHTGKRQRRRPARSRPLMMMSEVQTIVITSSPPTALPPLQHPSHAAAAAVQPCGGRAASRGRAAAAMPRSYPVRTGGSGVAGQLAEVAWPVGAVHVHRPHKTSLVAALAANLPQGRRRVTRTHIVGHERGGEVQGREQQPACADGSQADPLVRRSRSMAMRVRGRVCSCTNSAQLRSAALLACPVPFLARTSSAMLCLTLHVSCFIPCNASLSATLRCASCCVPVAPAVASATSASHSALSSSYAASAAPPSPSMSSGSLDEASSTSSSSSSSSRVRWVTTRARGMAACVAALQATT